jgi:hypothetical protein
MKSIQIFNEINIASNEFDNETHIEWVKSNIYLIDTIIEEIETLPPSVNKEIGEIEEKAVINFIVKGINSKELGRKQLNIIFLESILSDKARTIHIEQLKKVKKLYTEVVEILRHKKKVSEIENPEDIPIPNHLMKAMTRQQNGSIRDIKDSKERIIIIAKLRNTIEKNFATSPTTKIQELAKLDNKDGDYVLDRYLGFNFEKHEILFVRSILVIIARMQSLGEIENTDGMIYIPWSKIYEEFGITKRKKGDFHTKLTKPIREMALNMDGNLRKSHLVIDEFTGRGLQTQFILETEPIGNKLGLKLSSFLFFNKEKLQNCTLMDNKGLVRFKKVNKTDIGFSLFIWLERYISQQNRTKALNLTTIIKTLNLNEEYRKNKKRVVGYIERAFGDMVSEKTIISGWKKQKGVKNQDQYEFTSLRYKESDKITKSDDGMGKIINIVTAKVAKKLKSSKRINRR